MFPLPGKGGVSLELLVEHPLIGRYFKALLSATLWFDTKFYQGTHFSLTVKETPKMKRKILDERSVEKRFWTFFVWWDHVIKKTNYSSGCNLTLIWTSANEVATTTIINKTTISTTTSLSATTNYMKRRQQKRRKITKPETKQLELEDRSISSEKKEK